MANDPTKIDWSQLDDLTFQSEATPVETDAIPLWRNNTTGMLYSTIQDIIDLVPDSVAALSGGLDARDELTSQVDGERTSWQLSVTPASQNNLLVIIGNAVLTSGYSLSGDVLTLSSAPASGTPLVVYILSDPIPGTAGGNPGNVQYKGDSNALVGEDGFDYDADTNTLTVENIALSGTIDGRDPSVDGGVLDNVVGGSYSLDSRYYTETEVNALTWDASDIVSNTFAIARISEASVTQHEASIDHDALTNFVAAEHIDWTSTTENLSTSGTAATGALGVTGNITVSGTVDGVDVAALAVTVGTALQPGDVDDTPVNGETAVPVSSNWAYDHVAAADPHTGYQLELTEGAFVDGDKTKLDALGGSGTQYVVADYTELAAVGAAATGEVAAVTDAGIAGHFRSTNDGSPKTVNGGTVIAHAQGSNYRWERIRDGISVTPEWWGYANDGVTDDTAALQAAIDLRDGEVVLPATPLSVRAAIISQITIYIGTKIRGAGPGNPGWPGTRLQQLDGSNVSVIVPDSSVPTTEWMHGVKLSDFMLMGAWVDAPVGPGGTSTDGCGIDMDRRTGENFLIENVHTRYFAKSGIRLQKGSTPGGIFNCASFWNGEYGFDLKRTGSDVWHQFAVRSVSGDDNGLGLIRVYLMGSDFDQIYIDGVKGETKLTGLQQDLIILDTLNFGTVNISNVSQFNSPGTSSNSVIKIVNAGARAHIKNIRATSTLCVNFIDDVFGSRTMPRAGSGSQVLVDGFFDSSQNDPFIDLLTKDDFYWRSRRNQSGTAAPTTGTHYRGEIVFNTAPTSGGTLCWVCVTAGAPGIWAAVTAS